MKKLLYTLILMLYAVGLRAQDIPPNAPTAISPNFTWYKKITAGDTSFFAYSNGNWVNFARRNWVKKYVDSISANKANLLGGNSFTGLNIFQDLGARTIGLSSYGGSLIPGDISAGNLKVSSFNNGPFLGLTTYRNSTAKFRAGEVAGGGSYVIQKNIGFGSENWVNVFKTDSTAVTASNGLMQVGSDIQLGGNLTQNTTIEALNKVFTISGGNARGNFIFQARAPAGNAGDPDELPLIDLGVNTSTSISGLSVFPSATSIYTISPTTGQQSGISSDLSIVDQLNSKGLHYTDNYRSNFTDLSLVDKGYVDSLNMAYAKLSGGNTFDGLQIFNNGFNTPFNSYSTFLGQAQFNDFAFFEKNLQLQQQSAIRFSSIYTAGRDAYISHTDDGINPVALRFSVGSSAYSTPNKVGAFTLATTDDFISLVPYSGATNNLNLGGNALVLGSSTQVGSNPSTPWGGQIAPGSVSMNITTYGRNGLKIAGAITGNEIASFNDLNGNADNPGIIFRVPTHLLSNFLIDGNTSLNGNVNFTNGPTVHFDNPAYVGKILSVDGSGYLQAASDEDYAKVNADNGFNGTQKITGNNGTAINVITGATNLKQTGVDGYFLASGGGNFDVNKTGANINLTGTVNLNGEMRLSGGDFNIDGRNIYTNGSIFINSSPVYSLASNDARYQSAGSYLLTTGGTLTGDLILPSITPTNALSAAPKGYIDNLLTGITWKNAVRVKTTGNITLSGTQTVDGIALVAGNRVLVGSQTAPAQNGIYLVATGAWTRVSDADESAELEQATVLVTVGTANKNTQWTYIGRSAPVIGTDPIYFGQISGAGTYTNGSFLSLSGNVFDANLTAFDGRYEILSNKKTTLTNSSTDYPSTSAVTSALTGYVPTARTVAGFPLTSNVTLAAHTMGYGFLGGNYTGATAINTAIDTAGAVVSRLNLASQMPLKLSKTDTTAMLGTIVHKAIDETITGTKTLTKTLKGISFENSSNANFSSVSTTATGTVISRNVADGNIPLIVNNVSGSSFIQQWQQNGTGVAGINTNGTFYLNGFSNTATTNNAYLILPTTGAVISRNQADANPALIVNLSNAGATGNIQQWQSSAGAVAVLNNVGSFSTTGRINIGSTASPQALFQMSNTAYSSGSAFSTLGLASRQDNITLNSFAATTTSAFAAVNSLGIATLTANNNQTIGTTATLYIAGAPVLSNAAGGTLTTTNGAYALWVNGGNAYFGSSMISNGPILQNVANAYTSGSYSTLVRNASGRYETIDLTAFNSTTTALSSANLNSTYPSAALGFRVICGNITAGGMVYLKYAASTWLAIAAPVQP
ncbi:beta strand repeat-containing protein [Mucilaginibacter glaciei]|uniref:Autotransporter-associated beta strand protein n=1 Tax=Mucilaginibacter glaciei TaxID=2772109 RepID=A0A926S7E2_9SPHI|nr:hypothetical protein [Mucilaginibacter glaciei]MBD1394616.1 hypothetical protein [Mucilaginibacter glaciei]